MTVTVVETFADPVGDQLAVTLGTVPTGNADAVIVLLVGDNDVAFGTFTVNGDGQRDYLDLTEGSVFAADVGAVARLYPLEPDDEYLTIVPYDPYIDCWAAIIHVTDIAAIPADIVGQVNADLYNPTDVVTVDTSVIADGVIVAAAAIFPLPSDLVAPAGWTEIYNNSSPFRHVSIVYLDPSTAGALADAWTDGTVPTGGEGYVYSCGLQNVGLRHREGGSWVAPIGYGRPATVGTPPPRQYPPDSALPRTAPDPTPIVVPTPPWDTTRPQHRRR